MLSEGSKITRPEYLRILPEIESPITVRLKFVKLGSLQYISHLDLQRTFNRVLVRSGLPIWYTKGFNPHAKLVFSTPLSIGTQSECEFLDIRLDREMPLEDIKRMLNAEMSDEMYITDVYIPNAKFSDIAFCEYEYELFFKGASEKAADEIKTLFTTSPLNMIKRTKSGEKEIDIASLIKSIEVAFCAEDNAVRMDAVLSAGTDNFLNPEMLITALKERFAIFSGDLSSEWYSIIRKRSLDSGLKEFR
ncbi:MAG: DUF2344 domain-containing protein [Clostridia bacterium]|nr:DUF2344 domain-containing protein [Clostridia bacterium]